MSTSVELVQWQPETSRAAASLHALRLAASEAGVNLRTTAQYEGASEWLLLWGPGAPERASTMRQHVAAGGHAIALDLAYWSRDRKVRVSIDAAHPQAWVMRHQLSRQRFLADPAPTSDAWDPDGPILVAGIGQKAKVQYGSIVDEWEAQMSAECVRRYGRGVHYRPKPKTMQEINSIGLTLSGCSLVVTWHSNVAVDAIRLGIPVVCRDGAAAAVCASVLPEKPQPLAVEQRDKFLSNLAWFQWALPGEGPACWRWLCETLS